MPRLIFTGEANADLTHALEHCRVAYPLQLPQLHARLLAALDELQEAPLRWAIWRPPDYRRWLLPPYPLALVYHLDGTAVIIDALIHQRQDLRRRFPDPR